MKSPVTDQTLVAACGLYCGACKTYLKGKCPGCAKNEKATWCKVRTCCQESKIQTCAECASDAKSCKKLNNPISKLFALIFRSDRMACLQAIKEKGTQGFAEEMAAKGTMTVKKK